MGRIIGAGVDITGILYNTRPLNGNPHESIAAASSSIVWSGDSESFRLSRPKPALECTRGARP